MKISLYVGGLGDSWTMWLLNTTRVTLSQTPNQYPRGPRCPKQAKIIIKKRAFGQYNGPPWIWRSCQKNYSAIFSYASRIHKFRIHGTTESWSRNLVYDNSTLSSLLKPYLALLFCLPCLIQTFPIPFALWFEPNLSVNPLFKVHLIKYISLLSISNLHKHEDYNIIMT